MNARPGLRAAGAHTPVAGSVLALLSLFVLPPRPALADAPAPAQIQAPAQAQALVPNQQDAAAVARAWLAALAAKDIPRMAALTAFPFVGEGPHWVRGCAAPRARSAPELRRVIDCMHQQPDLMSIFAAAPREGDTVWAEVPPDSPDPIELPKRARKGSVSVRFYPYVTLPYNLSLEIIELVLVATPSGLRVREVNMSFASTC